MDLLSVPIIVILLMYANTATSAPFSSKELEKQVRTMMVNELKLYDAHDMKKSGQALWRGKISETIQTSTPEGICSLKNNSMIPNCFTYFVSPSTSAVSARFTMRRTRRRRSATVTAAIYELWQGESRNLLGRGDLDGDEQDNMPYIRIEILRNAAHWFNRQSLPNTAIERRVKVEVFMNGRPASYFDFFDGPPELDFAYNDGASKKSCDPSIECCLVEHYVNFTEIGWDKFIQYPAGFYANYCVGPSYLKCTHENPEVEYILSIARAQSELPHKPFACAPQNFAPLRILYTIGPNHSMSLLLHDMIALSCSCIA
ncbi:Transforming growth factor beta like domain protein [Trichostrongylus colubriformis]|uniref:Transforming growth factor beta like domain protein n=1 Tax=Trichostrongylus colubriformis TaxID=6319 RepID=A0AAN8IJ37_TRICO